MVASATVETVETSIIDSTSNEEGVEGGWKWHMRMMIKKVD